MRVILAHNFYSSAQPSGENLTVREIHAGLEAQGIDVSLIAPSSDDFGELGVARRLEVGQRPLWALRRTEFLDRVLAEKPDLVQVHNVYPFIPPSGLVRLERLGVAVTHVVHNYRPSCIAGSHFRDGKACFDCQPG